jgi:seryl-tRNA synthetase
MNSSDVQEMEHLINELTKNIKIIIASGQDNLERLIETKKGIAKEITRTRLDINGYLDRLEKELLTILKEKSESAKCEIKKSEATLKGKEKEIRECKGKLQNIKQQATDPQTYVALEQIEAAITKNEQFVQSLIDDEKVHKIMLDFEIHQKLKSLTTDVHRYGEVIISMIPCDFTEIR